MKLTLSQRILIGFIACGVLLLGVGIFSIKNSDKLITSSNLVNHTNVVISEFQQLLVFSTEIEISIRGYIITGDFKFVQTLIDDKIKIDTHLQKVKELTLDNPSQQKNIEDLREKFNLHILYSSKCLDLRKESFEKAKEFFTSDAGSQIELDIEKIISDSKLTEESLLVNRTKLSINDVSTFKIIFGILLFIVLIILIIVYGIVASNLTSLRKADEETARKNWLLTGNIELTDRLIGLQSIDDLAHSIISLLCTYLKANIGAIYLFQDSDKTLHLSGQYAFSATDGAKLKFRINEGIIGQAATEQKTFQLSDLDESQISITSTILNTKPKHIIIAPFLFEEKTLGVIEIGSLTKFTETEIKFINLSMDIIGISVNSAIDRKQILTLLEQTQIQKEEKENRAAELIIANKELAFQNDEKGKRAEELSLANRELAEQAEELQTQQEGLRQMNEELGDQAQNLIQQQEELQMSNEELQQQTQILELKNIEVEAARNNIEIKTKQLEVSSKYKSEFLANMSHELRTPLNSLLILSKDLSENRKGNLDSIQVECAEIIYKSGHDLLLLINEVLDLSKIEAGKMSVNIENVSLQQITDDIMVTFKHQAEMKGLKLTCNLKANLPTTIRTDSQRLTQILKNLISNAIKFTDHGNVIINVFRYSQTTINISVTDTGVGIMEDKQLAIFEAFQQADGGTSRKYGGTGLGLSISRELAKLLGAEIKVISKINEGSTFSIILPNEFFDKNATETSIIENKNVLPFNQNSSNGNSIHNYAEIKDNRNAIKSGDKVVLIIEDDIKFAEILLKQANSKGFKCLSATSGEEGLTLAIQYNPNAIILDMNLSGMNGNQVLHELNSNPSLRHISVHTILASENSLNNIKEGLIEYIVKPIAKDNLDNAIARIENNISRKLKNLLIIEENESSRKATRKLIENGNVKCFEAKNGEEAITLYSQNHIDCIILDIVLPDISGFDLIRNLENIIDHTLSPIIVYTGKELTKEEDYELQKYAESIIIKGIKSEERLLDEAALFLHRTISNLPKSKQLIMNNVHDNNLLFQSKKILLVDDDIRNVFALSKILSERGLEIINAENGKIALEMLNLHSNIDLVLMDIMMPEMDGYEAMRRIRAQRRLKNLPIIALTAKAMKEDKQKCIDAGANDYITKPIDVERLLSLMRVWMSN